MKNITLISTLNKLFCLLAAAVLVLCGGLSGCSKHPNPGGGETGTETTVTLEINVPGATELKSRSLTDPEERYLSTLDLLLFEIDGGGDEILVEWQKFDDTQINNTSHVKTVQTKFDLAPLESYRIVLLANVAQYVHDLDLAGKLVIGHTKKSDLLANLPYFNINTNWDGSIYLPMWGETLDPISNPSGGVTTVRSVQLIRSLARLDIRVNVPESHFKLHEVYVLRYNSKATIIPDHYSTMEVGVTAPTVRSDISLASVPIGFTGLSSNIFEQEIYLAEQVNAGKGSDDQIGIYIFGYYEGTADGWYKIDFRDPATDDIFDILRNYRYVIDINEVNGQGAPTIDEADIDNSLISADVIPWNEATMEQAYFPDYYFNIDKTEFHFNADGRQGRSGYWDSYDNQNFVPAIYEDHLITLSTNDPAGWRVTKVLDENGSEIPETDRWVTVGKGMRYEGKSGNQREYFPNQAYLRVLPNGGLASRYARIYVQAGRHEHIIRVTQNWVDCPGRNDVEVLTQIGSKEYPVHIYFNEEAEVIRCWMTKNLAEITPDFDNDTYVQKRYDNTQNLHQPGTFIAEEGERGYYYSLEKMIPYKGFDPCPEGWHLPTWPEFVAFIHYVAAVPNVKYDFSAADIQALPPHRQWFFDSDRVAGGWRDGDFNYWYGIDNYSYMYLAFMQEKVSYTGIQSMSMQFFMDGSRRLVAGSYSAGDKFYPVRCVKDVD